MKNELLGKDERVIGGNIWISQQDYLKLLSDIYNVNIELDRVKGLAEELDAYTTHTRRCYDSAISLNDCNCGLKEIRQKLKGGV